MANKCACGWGSALDLAGAAYSAPADLIAGLRCLTSKGKGSAPSDPLIALRGPTSKGRVRREKGGGVKGRATRVYGHCDQSIFVYKCQQQQQLEAKRKYS